MHRHTRMNIDLNALEDNLGIIQEIVGEKSILFVVKGNAYGHGAVEVSRRAESKSLVSYFGVAFEEEAQELRDAGIKSPILVMGPPSCFSTVGSLGLTATIFNHQHLKEIAATPWEIKAHVKVDTGLHRMGIHPNEVVDFIAKSQSIPNLKIEGIYTHLATAEAPCREDEYLKQQLQVFSSMLESLDSKVPQWVHITNTAASLEGFDIGNMVRIGIGAFGFDPIGRLPLRPVMSLESQITHIQKISEGYRVGYGAEYISEEDQIIGTIPIGWGDGLYDAKGCVLPSGGITEACPFQVIQICMDQTIIRLPKDKDLRIGDPVKIIPQVKDVGINHMSSIKKSLGFLNKRIPRVYFSESR